MGTCLREIANVIGIGRETLRKRLSVPPPPDHGGKTARMSHFKSHGIKMGFKNPVQYTKATQGVIKSGQYLAQKNAYAILFEANKYYFVGVNQAGTHITTFGIRTFTKIVASTLGLL